MTTTASDLDGLAEACAQAAAALPAAQVILMADRAATLNGTTSDALKERPPTANYRNNATAVIAAWRNTNPPVTGTVVAAMLHAALTATQRTRREQTIDLVWTGPGTDTIHAQPTSNVVVNLINEAKNSVVLCTFASRRVPTVHQALHHAAQRGVAITLILENEDSSNGQYKAAEHDPFDGIPAQTFEWAANQRPTTSIGWTPALHAKFILVDERTLFVTSANLTGFALDHNIEAGTLIRGGPLPSRLTTHLRQLIYRGVLSL